MISHRTWEFKRQLAALPAEVQRKARAKYRLFRQSPHHPSLRRHRLRRHPPYESVSITINYRVVFRPGERLGDRDVYVWVWVGAHSNFNQAFP
jgi:hypothetical protein